MAFDDILESIGVFGRLQQRIYLGLCWREFCSGMVTIIHVFLAGQGDHWCKSPNLETVNCTKWSLDENTCLQAKKLVSVPMAKTKSDVYENCVMYNLTGFEPMDLFPDRLTSVLTNDTLECNAGWVYDTSQFQTTIVSDVSFPENMEGIISHNSHIWVHFTHKI